MQQSNKVKIKRNKKGDTKCSDDALPEEEEITETVRASSTLLKQAGKDSR